MRDVLLFVGYVALCLSPGALFVGVFTGLVDALWIAFTCAIISVLCGLAVMAARAKRNGSR